MAKRSGGGGIVPMGLAVIVGAFAIGHYMLASKASAATQTAAAAAAVTEPKTVKSGYTDGTYTGPVADAYYGQVQVEAIIKGGKIANVRFLRYPNTHQTSVYINRQAMPMLTQEAVQAQSANVNGVSGATATSQGFRQSLASALSKARA